jgi:hypothetical protein
MLPGKSSLCEVDMPATIAKQPRVSHHVQIQRAREAETAGRDCTSEFHRPEKHGEAIRR